MQEKHGFYKRWATLRARVCVGGSSGEVLAATLIEGLCVLLVWCEQNPETQGPTQRSFFMECHVKKLSLITEGH